MRSESVTLIWLAKFENETELKDYLDWKYRENEDEPKCAFAEDIGLTYFDSDFLESLFVPSSFNILEQIENISFVVNFREQLFAKITDLDYSNKNSIISISGKKNLHGSINEKLFDFTPRLNDKNYLHFIGLFKYLE